MEIKRTKEVIADITYTGFGTVFDLPVEELQRMWWKYSKSLGIVENMKSHYLVKIPAQEKGLAAVSLVEKTTGDQKKSMIFLAVLDQTNNTYKEQVKDVLLEFKTKYYVSQLEVKIMQKEKELAKEGERYGNMVADAQKSGLELSIERKKVLLDNITKISFELEALKLSLDTI